MNNLRKLIRNILKEATHTFDETEVIALKIAYRSKVYTSRDLLTELRGVKGVVTVSQSGPVSLLKKGIETMSVDIRFIIDGREGKPRKKDGNKLIKMIDSISGVYFVKALGFGEENRVEDVT
jgi:hypothetical protein